LGKRRPIRPAAPSKPPRVTLLLSLLLVLAGIWAYSTSFRGVFVWDDGEAIVENRHIKSLWPLTQSMSAPAYSTVAGRPVAAFTLAINYALAPAEARDVMAPAAPQSPPETAELFYKNVWGYHALNLVIHLLAGLTLFGVVRRTLTVSSLIAFSVALLWVVHPLQTESVTYVIQRVESLMGLFYLLTVYCSIRAWTPGPARRWWIAGAVAACTAGMATKEVMVTAPVMVLLWDWIFGGRSMTWAEIRRQRWPLYLGLAATWIPLGILVAGLSRETAVGYGYGWTWWSYLVTQTAIITQYLRLSLVPEPLVFDYGWQPASWLSVAPQAALLVAIAAATTWLVIKRRAAGFLGAWLLLILGPSSSVIPIASEVAAEHRMYLPLAAVLVFVVGGLAHLFRARGLPPRIATAAGLIAVLGTATTFAAMTRDRNRDYWDNEGLWRKTVTQRPQNGRAHAVYAMALLARGLYTDAERHLREAVRLEPGSALAHRNLGIALCATQRTGECLVVLERAAVLEPSSGETRGLLGEAYLAERQPQRAIQEFLQALELMPDSRASRFLLNRTAWLLATWPDASVRDGAKAVALAERGVQLTGRKDPRLLDTLAAAHAETGRFSEAVMAGREAMTLAERQNDASLVSEIQQHLTAFAAGHKLRQAQQ